MIPSLDFETYSEAGFIIDPHTGKVRGASSQGKGGLPVVGTPVYAAHPSTGILCAYYDLKDGRGQRAWYPGTPDPVDLFAFLAGGGLLEAWNVTFEFWIWNLVGVRRYGWPVLPLEQCRCAMAKSRRFSLPGALGKASKVLGTLEKDKEGGRLIQKLTRPHTPTKNRPAHRWTPATAWDDFLALYKYCGIDVAAEDEASAKTPDLTPHELDVWQMDQRINVRGVHVDTGALDAMLDVLGQTERKYTLELVQLTGGAVGSVSEVAKLGAWLGTQGCHLPNLQKETVDEAVNGDTLALYGHPAWRALQIRQVLSAANVKKLRTLKLQVSADGRLRDQYMYCGADRTGRWCLTGDHEVLTPDGWVALDRWGGGSIACWSEDGAISFDAATPNAFDYVGDMHHWGGGRFAQVATPEHRMPAVTAQGSNVSVEVQHVLTTMRFPRSGSLPPSSRYTDGELRFFVMVQADGHFANRSLRLKFSKARKVFRCRHVLRALHIQHRERVNGDGTTVFDIAYGYLPSRLAVFGKDKTFPAELLTADHDVFFDELRRWDAYESGPNSVQYTTTNKVNADLVQAKAHLSGRSCNIVEKHRDVLGWSVAYCCNIWNKYVPTHGRSIKRTVLPYQGKVYCPTTSTGFFLVRRKGVCWITGNSAGGVQLQNITAKGPKSAECEACGEYFNPMGDACPHCGSFLFHVMPDWTVEAVESAIRCLLSRDLATVERVWEDAIAVMCGCLRGLFIAKPGHDFICCDFSAIEAVAAACLARCQWRIDVFSGHGKIYEESASRATGIPFDEILQYKKDNGMHHPARKTIGKVRELAGGFSGWIGAWKAFGADAFMTDDEIKADVLKWREESPEIVDMWGGQFRWCGPGKWDYRPELFGLEGAVINAILHPGQYFSHIDITYAVQNDILYCRLPSGRLLHYHRPRLSNAVDKLNRGPSYQITFEGYNSNSQKGPVGWHRLETFGGRLFENCVAEDTDVLTPRGWVPVQDVRPSDRVHDGVGWVRHGGLLFKSEQACVTVDGVLMTGDHKVLTYDGWQAASQNPRPYRPNLRDVDGGTPRRKRREETKVGVPLRVWAGVRESVRRYYKGFKERTRAELWLRDKILPDVKRLHPRHESAPGLRGLQVNAGQVQTADASGVGELRGQGHYGLRSVAGRFPGFLARHGAVVSKKRAARPERQQPGVLSGELPVGSRQGEREQQTDQRTDRYARRTYDYLASVRRFRGKSHHAMLSPLAQVAGRRSVPRPEFRPTKKVYDLVNAGPRQRFVIRGEGGPFIVHNCVQAVARDIQADALLRCEDAGYPIVMHTHDEGTAEVLEGFGSVEEMAAIMSERPEWAAWWPLRAAGWRHKRYQKD